MDDLAIVCVELGSMAKEIELCRLAAREAAREVAESSPPADDAIGFIEPVLDTLANLYTTALRLQDSALGVGLRLHDRVCKS